MDPGVFDMPARRGHFLEWLAFGTRQGAVARGAHPGRPPLRPQDPRGNGIPAAAGVLPISGFLPIGPDYGTVSDPEIGTAWPVLAVRRHLGHDPGLTSPSVHDMRGEHCGKLGTDSREDLRIDAGALFPGMPVVFCVLGAGRELDPIIRGIRCTGIPGPTIILVHLFEILFRPDLDKHPQGGLEAGIGCQAV